MWLIDSCEEPRAKQQATTSCWEEMDEKPEGETILTEGFIKVGFFWCIFLNPLGAGGTEFKPEWESLGFS
jgi:hypothetical protein